MAKLEHSYDAGNMKRNEILDLGKILKNPEVHRDQAKCRKYIQQVIAYMTLGMDVSSLFSDMIKASATNDLVAKKLIYLYIRVQAKCNQDAAILVVATLTKDTEDDNAMVRGLALRTMCELKVSSLLEYVKVPLLNGLQDKSSYVRRIAVMGALKVFTFAPNMIRDMTVLRCLFELAKSNDAQVMANSIYVLKEILSARDCNLFTKDVVDAIFSRFYSLDEWAQVNVISLLSCYKPSSEEEIFGILNNLDDILKNTNKGVVIATAKLFLLITKDVDSLKSDVYIRLKGPLFSIAASSVHEVSYTGLHVLLTIYRGRAHILAGKYKAFFLRGNDSPYLKRLKLSVLTEMSAESNIDSTLSELRYSVMDSDVYVAKFAVSCIGKVGTKCKFAAASCLDILVELLSLDLDFIIPSIFEAFKAIVAELRDLDIRIAEVIHTSWQKLSDPSAKSSIIWILGELGHNIPRCPYILEGIADSLEQEQLSDINIELLHTALHLFFKRPPEFQNVVGRVLFLLMDGKVSMDIHDRALFYYRALQMDPTKVSKLLHASRNLKMQAVLKELSLFREEVALEDLNTVHLLLSQQV